MPMTALPGSAPAPASMPGAARADSTTNWGLWGAGGLLVALGLLSWTLSRRAQRRPRHIHVVETASLGPKRSLSLVVVGRQSLLLSCSDAGVALLSSQPATEEMLATLDASRTGLAGSVSLQRAEPVLPSPFESQLAEADDLQRVRLRLAQAQQAGGPAR